jgi:hypothetical protein
MAAAAGITATKPWGMKPSKFLLLMRKPLPTMTLPSALTPVASPRDNQPSRAGSRG